VIVTDELRRLMQASGRKKFTVTVVPVVPENPTSRAPARDPLVFESVSLVVHQDPTAAGIPLPPVTA
jgi:hypothetical protein